MPLKSLDINSISIFAREKVLKVSGGGFRGQGPKRGSGSAPSWGTASNNSNPLFVNAGSDFHLQATSPAIAVGESLVNSVVTQDLEGVLRPQGSNDDLGAHEYAPGYIPPPNEHFS
jgi:hypothetical protein